MMPTGTFPDVTAPEELFDKSRRRAKLRKTRTVVAAASVAVALGAGGVYGLGQASDKNDLLVGNGPTPSTQPRATPATDAQLIAMADGCDSRCTVVGRLQMRDGNTFAVVGKKEANASPATPGPWHILDFVVARGNQLVSKLAPASASRPSYTVYTEVGTFPWHWTDSTGNVIVMFQGGATAQWYLPFRLVQGQLTLVQGTFEDAPISGDHSSGIADANRDGQLEIVTVGHDSSSGTRVYTYKSWRWDGTVYREYPCTPHLARTAPTSCGLATYPTS